ncbi:MAG: phospholipase D family protein [Lachnospiraceae bacterium]|nr:phospholipase D family protein [Lachnospiraceae bacterium]
MARYRFDQNNNRVDYGELLAVDVDYELDQAVGMTYSLDMEALMGIPLCLGMRGEMTSGQRNNPLYVLEAIRRTGKKLSIFCNAGCIKVPKTESRLFALLEDSIHEVRMPKHIYNFHPKLWVLQYHNINDGRVMIKVVALSRNLTFDQSMDMAVEMTGFVGTRINPKNQPIADMLQFVAQFDRKENHFDQLVSNVKKVDRFELLDCFEDYTFHPFGIYGKSENGIKKVTVREHKKSARELFRNCQSLFIVSPFLSENVIADLLDDFNESDNAGPKSRCLITRETSVTKKIYDAFNRNPEDGIWVVDPVFSSNDGLGDNDTYGFADRDVHAKVYYIEKANEPHKLYLGSLNASYNAFNHNVEFLLELTYKRYYTSYSLVKDDFIPEKESPFIRLREFNETNDKEEEKAADFREEVYSVQSAEIIPDNDKFIIKVCSERDFENVTIRPFFIKTDIQPLRREVEFRSVSINCLSNMFILAKDGYECLIRLEVTGMPEQEREDAIFNEIISNRPMFMAYMRYLLDEDFYDSISFEDLILQGSEAGDAKKGYGFTVEPDIYERMLRAAADYPECFDSMYEVVRKIDDDKIGEEFRQLLELFMKAVGRKEKGRK